MSLDFQITGISCEIKIMKVYGCLSNVCLLSQKIRQHLLSFGGFYEKSVKKAGKRFSDKQIFYHQSLNLYPQTHLILYLYSSSNYQLVRLQYFNPMV